MLENADIHAIVSLVDGKYLMVEPPKPEDAKELAAIKCFLLAAIGRREIDQTWDKELSQWFFKDGGIDLVSDMNVAKREKRN